MHRPYDHTHTCKCKYAYGKIHKHTHKHITCTLAQTWARARAHTHTHTHTHNHTTYPPPPQKKQQPCYARHLNPMHRTCNSAMHFVLYIKRGKRGEKEPANTAMLLINSPPLFHSSAPLPSAFCSTSQDI